MNALDVLDQLRSLPQVRLTPKTEAITDVVFHGRTVASLDSDRQSAEIAVPSGKLGDVLTAHPDARAGANGVTVRLTSPEGARTAMDLARRRLDEVMFGWQSGPASP